MANYKVSTQPARDWGISDLLVKTMFDDSLELRFEMAIRNLMQTSIGIRVPIFQTMLPKTINYGRLYLIEQLLLLVPSIDYLVDVDKNFVSTAVDATRGGACFPMIFRWIASGRRSIEDFGLSVHKLFVLARNRRWDRCSREVRN
jgi:hypothetical protein